MEEKFVKEGNCYVFKADKSCSVQFLDVVMLKYWTVNLWCYRYVSYYQKIKNHTFPVYRAHQMKVQEIMIRRLIFGLKSMYFSRLEFERDFGFDVIDIFGNKLKELACNGYLTISEDSIIPTIEGAILADDIIREFYLPKNSKMMLGHVRRD